MNTFLKKLILILWLTPLIPVRAQNLSAENDVSSQVNVFLGTSGDHGQLSPAASYPLSMMSIGPQTYPKLHAGYEYEAKRFLGFTHNRFEGVGCQGSGGNILIKPFTGNDTAADLMKTTQTASPGYYQASFSNQINAEFTVFEKSGMHQYTFPEGKKGFVIDLGHTLANKFVDEAHLISDRSISGWVAAKTTCNVGTYRVYYYLQFNHPVKFEKTGPHTLLAGLPANQRSVEIRIAFSSVSVEYARAQIFKGSFEQMRSRSAQGWNKLLSRITVQGTEARKKMFYSLLYRTLQSPYVVSEQDGSYRGINGQVHKTTDTLYNGWAIWDNYRTQLPLLAISYPEKYKGMVTSISNMFLAGKKDFATQTEPTNTVRTEHAIVVLLDAYRKGFPVNFEQIADSLIRDVDRLDFSKPDKALESSYDTWALAEILALINRKEASDQYRRKALEYRNYWNKDFKDLSKPDVDKVQARGLYQGTIWQYRWFAPFDVKGLIALTGGMPTYMKELDHFFDNDLYNHANEPDLQVPLLYNVTRQPWKSQELMHRFAVDTVVQFYFNDNSRGIDPFIDVVYKNEPKAFIRTMDDDAGAMSAWYVLTACGFSPACPGWPVYYLNVPLFKSITFNWPGKKPLHISVDNYGVQHKYIQGVTLNGKIINRNYLTHEELMGGGQLVISASPEPNKTWGTDKQWISDINK